MIEIRWTLQAADDLQAIYDYIARDSPHYELIKSPYRIVYRTGEVVKILTIFRSSRLLPPIDID
ncbi:MAG: hypothetical protein DMF74_28075 [Acidobacteria bacterium]|nr:MAG: hypothetical protein DMF74_28075 [Acidobacteriota bacterium]